MDFTGDAMPCSSLQNIFKMIISLNMCRASLKIHFLSARSIYLLLQNRDASKLQENVQIISSMTIHLQGKVENMNISVLS